MLFGNRGQRSGIPGFDAGMGGPGTPILAPMQNIAPTASAPFVWGDGGAQITPAEISRRRVLADAAGKSDYSPVSHWTQGLGRVVDALSSRLETRKLDKATAANTEHSAAIMQALLGGNGDAASAAMMDPTLSSDVQGFARMQWERAHPKPVNNDTLADMNLMEEQLGPGAGKRFLEGKIDPIVTIPLPGGQTYVGPRSGLSSLMGGGGPASTAGAPPTTLPPDFQFDEGGPSVSPPRAGFRR